MFIDMIFALIYYGLIAWLFIGLLTHVGVFISILVYKEHKSRFASQWNRSVRLVGVPKSILFMLMGFAVSIVTWPHIYSGGQ